MKRNAYTIDDLFAGIRAGDNVLISQSITLIESTRAIDRTQAQQLIDQCLPFAGNSLRIGITGVPGAGKSTFIESIGKYILKKGKLAVLAIDPSSKKTRGSILGDKTRMPDLSAHPDVFIRPSPAGTTLGGVASKTKETIILLEAAGYDHIIVETVGVGQSETAVYEMVDIFLLLMIAGAGDELQGIKKGILEMSDLIVINKADGDNIKRAQMAKSQLSQALHLLQAQESGIEQKIMLCSALRSEGLADIWSEILQFADATASSGYFQQRRNEQNVRWLHTFVEEQLKYLFLHRPGVKDQMDKLSKEVENGRISPFKAAQDLLKKHFQGV